MDNPEACTRLFACPVCGEPLGDVKGSARCPNGHSFDYARSGYINLTLASGRGGRIGDSAEMVRSRKEFLAAGHFQPLGVALAEAADEALAGEPEGAIIEIGCGTGYYLAAVTEVLRQGRWPGACGFGFDLSKPAVDGAAKAFPQLRFAVADVEAGIPLVDSGAALALSVFAPRPGAELGRIVAPGGGLLVAFAGPDHLRRLRERLDLLDVGAEKLERLRERLAPWFELAATASVGYELELSAEDARRLVSMGPNARHGPNPAAITESLDDRVSVSIASFRRR